MKRKMSTSSLIFDTANTIFMVLFCISIIIPFWDMVMMSFSGAEEAMTLTLRLWPKQFRIGAYIFAFRNSQILDAYVVTIARTAIGVGFSLLINISMAYSLSKKELPFHNLLTVLILIPMFFSGGLIPTYLLIKKIGLYDSFWVYILPCAFSSYNIILLRNYFSNMDHNLEEAAIIDGAANLRIMFQIVMPLAKPIIATVALWGLVWHWNEWMNSLIYIKNSKLYTLQFILRRMINDDKMMSAEMKEFNIDNQNANYVTKNLQAALTVVAIAPIMATYPFLQKYFVKGIMVGALKG